MNLGTITKLNQDVELLRAQLAAAVAERDAAVHQLGGLRAIAEEWASSDPDMPSHADAERRFDKAMNDAFKFLASLASSPSPGGGEEIK